MRKIQLDGFIGRDCETKTNSKNAPFITFSLCTNVFEEGESKSIWYNCTCFDYSKIQSRIPYLKRGKYLFLTGTPKEKLYTAKDGTIKIDYSIIVDSIDFLNSGTKKEGDETTNENRSYNNEPKMTAYKAPSEPKTEIYQTPPETNNYYEPEIQNNSYSSDSGSDEDLPF